jgi:type II secretory pathway pseudopilin PulG
VAVAILVVLAGLLLPSILRVKDTAKDSATKQRINQIEDGLRMAHSDTTRLNLALQDALFLGSPQENLRFEPLRAVLAHLTNLPEDPLKLHDMAQVALYQDKNDKLNLNVPLPPNLASIYDTNIGNLPQKIRNGQAQGHTNRGTKGMEPGRFLRLAATWYAVRDDPVQGIREFSATLDRVIMFEDFQRFTNDLAWFTVNDGKGSGRNFTAIDKWGTFTGTPYPFWVLQVAKQTEQSFWWCHRGLLAIGAGEDGRRYEGNWDPSSPTDYAKDASGGAYNRHYGWDSRVTFNIDTDGGEDQTSTGNVLAWRTLFNTKPVTGESIDQTYEVIPETVQNRSWYYATWPTLIENGERDDSDKLVENGAILQRAWPNADWDQEAPGHQPPILEMPFGAKILSAKTGNPADQTLVRGYIDTGSGFEIYQPTVAEFSPLATIRLLEIAGIISDPEQYRKDRSPDKPWNDAWGNPIILAAAAFIAPRHDLADPGNWSNQPSDNFDGEYFGKFDEDGDAYHRQFHNDLFGGRDYFLFRSQEFYQQSRKTYIAVGAIGPHFVLTTGEENNDVLNEFSNTSGELTWDAANDDIILRALWRHVSDITEANEWTGDVTSNPPWDGIRKVTEREGAINRNTITRKAAGPPGGTKNGFPVYTIESEEIELDNDVTSFISAPKEF